MPDFETKITKARAFAVKAHCNQKYDGQPYVFHLDMVAQVLERFGHKEEIILTAAYLHDVLEDTNVNYFALFNEFGQDIAALVHSVTDCKGSTRTERKRLTNEKLKTCSDEAMNLKLADRIANTMYSFLNSKQKYEMYKREWYDFFPLMLKRSYSKTGNFLVQHGDPKMWDFLGRLYV